MGLFFLLILAIVFIASLRFIIHPQSSFSFSIHIYHDPQPSFNNILTNQIAGTCSFTVTIRTSCSSIRNTRDHISLSFGDAYGNQVYAPRLENAYAKTFERCSTHTFLLNGPCTYQICYLHLYRSGYDGWVPYDVTVYGINTKPVTFYYNSAVPQNTWYGYNHCSGTGAVSSAIE